MTLARIREAQEVVQFSCGPIRGTKLRGLYYLLHNGQRPLERTHDVRWVFVILNRHLAVE
ncbi:hypothetical protein BV20DRAFT_970056 [Pilatotrama ljubarskyi]|nr:hypothetical protein BV20DRAFT_970056 [Pilatotrama ljubarskyi]